MDIPLFYRKAVAALVLGVPCMTLDPVEGNVVLLQQGQQLLPKVYIQSRLLVGLYPALFLPAVYPALGDTVYHILAVGSEYDPAWLLQRGKSRYNAEQLHSVVGGGAVAA